MLKQAYSVWSGLQPKHQLSRCKGLKAVQPVWLRVVNMTNDDSSCTCHTASSLATAPHNVRAPAHAPYANARLAIMRNCYQTPGYYKARLSSCELRTSASKE